MGFTGKDGKVVYPQEKTEDLGTKYISGLTCTGLRITETIPPGTQGNDKAITVTREQWFSPELGIAVLWITDDPRSGVDTREILGLDRGEPDPSLFQIPDGYWIRGQASKRSK